MRRELGDSDAVLRFFVNDLIEISLRRKPPLSGIDRIYMIFPNLSISVFS